MSELTNDDMRTVVEHLRTGLKADFWYDAKNHGDIAAESVIYNTQWAMGHAADLIEQLVDPSQLTADEETGDEFTVPDNDLNELLNLTAAMVKGRANQDTGTLWLRYLERIQQRLAAVPADMLDCVELIAEGYTELNHATQELTCAHCGISLDDDTPHKIDCMKLRAQALLDALAKGVKS